MSTTISGTSGVTFPDSTSMQTGQQACKAWVNFNGTGTVAIRGSYNVSSITDNGTGIYRVNFTTNMPDSNYAVVGTNKQRGGVTLDTTVSTATTQTDKIEVYSMSNGSMFDSEQMSVSVFSN